jgi:NAD(P)-dependent dehydrogenase (short-subunit alcohol dehydrogenase family)
VDPQLTAQFLVGGILSATGAWLADPSRERSADDLVEALIQCLPGWMHTGRTEHRRNRTPNGRKHIMGQLDGKVAFITGAARGQGRSHALTLAREGADIIAVDICRQASTVPYPMATPEDLATTVKQVEALDRRIIASEVDIRDLAALTAAADDGAAQLGRLDIVVANAGISTPASSLEMDEQVWDEMIEINLTGQWKTLRAAVPHIITGGRGGAVVITSSEAAIMPYPNTAHYWPPRPAWWP